MKRLFFCIQLICAVNSATPNSGDLYPIYIEQPQKGSRYPGKIAYSYFGSRPYLRIFGSLFGKKLHLTSTGEKILKEILNFRTLSFEREEYLIPATGKAILQNWGKIGRFTGRIKAVERSQGDFELMVEMDCLEPVWVEGKGLHLSHPRLHAAPTSTYVALNSLSSIPYRKETLLYLPKTLPQVAYEVTQDLEGYSYICPLELLDGTGKRTIRIYKVPRALLLRPKSMEVAPEDWKQFLYSPIRAEIEAIYQTLEVASFMATPDMGRDQILEKARDHLLEKSRKLDPPSCGTILGDI